MKTMLLLCACCVAVGCGRGTVGEPDVQLEGDRAELRFRSENSGGFQFLELAIKEIRMVADGREVPVRLMAGSPDYLAPNHAPLVAELGLPTGAQAFQVEVVFDDFGAFETDTSQGFIDARIAPLSFEGTRDDLFTAGHAVVHLDLQRSLAEDSAAPEQRLLLPNVNVRF